MAVYDQSYQAWTGRRQSRLHRIWALTRAGARLPLASKWNLLVMGLIYMMILGWIFILYVVASTDSPPLFVLGNNLYREWFFNHGMFGFLIMILTATVGAALISRDLQHNALLTYFAKGITRTDYLVAKFLTLALFLLSVTLGPALLLFVGQLAMGMEDLTWKSTFRDLAAITGHSLVLVVPFTSMVLCVSSLTKRPYVAGILWVLMYVSTWIVPAIQEVRDSGTWWKAIRLQDLAAHVSNAFYEHRPFKGALVQLNLPSQDMPCPRWVSWLILAGMTFLSLAILRVRLRIAEERE